MDAAYPSPCRGRSRTLLSGGTRGCVFLPRRAPLCGSDGSYLPRRLRLCSRGKSGAGVLCSPPSLQRPSPSAFRRRRGCSGVSLDTEELSCRAPLTVAVDVLGDSQRGSYLDPGCWMAGDRRPNAYGAVACFPQRPAYGATCPCRRVVGFREVGEDEVFEPMRG